MNSVLATVTLDDGNSGTGEVPTSLAFTNESIEVIAKTLNVANRELKGVSIDDWAEWTATYRNRWRDTPMTASGLEVALFRAWLKEQRKTEHSYWGGMRSRLDTDITIPYLTKEPALTGWIEAAAAGGFTAYKLKIGGDEQTDKALLNLVRSVLVRHVPGFRLRLDGNQCYSAAGFLRFLSYLDKSGHDIELIEQPLRKDDFRGYEEIMERIHVPILLDESVVSYEDAARAIDNNLCDGINVKIAKSGLLESHRLIQIARQAGKKLMIGCMIETIVGLSAAVFLAAGTAAFDFIDLDSVHFLHGENRYPGIEILGPTISVHQNNLQ
jgi:L-alanine-DL-glutamate epimerase-like enolase superfamily enzyme